MNTALKPDTSRNPNLDSLSPMEPDALLGLMAEFRQDQRANKVDLGVGVYRDEDGKTPIMKAVKQAEERLLEIEDTKTYQGSRGSVSFCESIENLVLGRLRSLLAGRVTSLATPGGCGAIYLAVHLAARLSESATVWISDPSWPNHAKIARGAGLTVRSYPYLHSDGFSVDFGAVVDCLSGAESGDLVILQGPCHNPTGIDFSVDQWIELAQVLQARGLLPLFDVAYHGLGEGLDVDIFGIQACLERLPQALISYSCSKSFGLYRERTGCLLAVTSSRQVASASLSHLEDISRISYSMPPSHGQAIVDIILRDASLTSSWSSELSDMRNRLGDLRAAFLKPIQNQLSEHGGLHKTKGMFLQLNLADGIALDLRTKHGIYLPNSGRVNLAGLTMNTAESTGGLFAQHVA